MKKQIILCTVLLFLNAATVSAQTGSKVIYRFDTVSASVQSKVFPISSVTPIASMVILGQAQLRQSNSLVRAVIIDDKNQEYLIYEAYPAITDVGEFTFIDECEETCDLKNITPKALRLEGVNAKIELTELDSKITVTRTGAKQKKGCRKNSKDK